MWSSSWVQVVAGLFLVVVGLATASSRVLPGPAWMWGARDPVTGAPLPAVRASGTGAIAMGGWLLLQAWFWLAAPRDPWVVAATVAVGLCFLGCAVGFDVWSIRLRRAGRR